MSAKENLFKWLFSKNINDSYHYHYKKKIVFRKEIRYINFNNNKKDVAKSKIEFF